MFNKKRALYLQATTAGLNTSLFISVYVHIFIYIKNSKKMFLANNENMSLCLFILQTIRFKAEKEIRQ